jgi:hypothetical protein
MPRAISNEAEELRCKKISDTLKGHKVSDETRQKIIDAQKGIPKSKESCKKMSESHKGKIHSEETRKKISDSNKGKKLSDEHIQRLKEFNTGKKVSDETKAKLRDANIGKYPSDESRKKMSESHKGERHPMFGKRGEGTSMFGKHHTNEVCERLSIIHSGENNPMFGKVGDLHPNWNGGTSYLPYCFKFNEKRKRAVREYFNNLCICTGEPSHTRALNVHHVDHDKEQGCNGKPFNLVPMCDKHHNMEQHNQEDYKSYINKTLREGFKWGIWNEQDYIEQVMY